jgi:hypothetical protein
MQEVERGVEIEHGYRLHVTDEGGLEEEEG